MLHACVGAANFLELPHKQMGCVSGHLITQQLCSISLVYSAQEPTILGPTKLLDFNLNAGHVQVTSQYRGLARQVMMYEQSKFESWKASIDASVIAMLRQTPLTTNAAGRHALDHKWLPPNSHLGSAGQDSGRCCLAWPVSSLLPVAEPQYSTDGHRRP